MHPSISRSCLKICPNSYYPDYLAVLYHSQLCRYYFHNGEEYENHKEPLLLRCRYATLAVSLSVVVACVILWCRNQ